jgi:hypothetical protein
MNLFQFADGNFRMDFGERLRFAERDFAIVAALQRRNDGILSRPLFPGRFPVC